MTAPMRRPSLAAQHRSAGHHRLTRLLLATVLAGALASPPIASGSAGAPEQSGNKAAARPRASRLLSSVTPASPTVPRGAQKAERPATDASRTGGRDVVPGEVVVGFSPSSEDEALAAATALGGGIKKRARTGRLAVVRVPKGRSVESFASELKRKRGVAFAEPNVIVRAAWVPDDPGFAQQWSLDMVGASAAWDVSRGASVKVAVIDTGADLDHPDLVGRLDTSNDWDFVNNDASAQDDENQGHGTHVTGIVAATADNGTGVAGLANQATVLPIKSLDASGTGSSADIAAAIDWATGKGVSVINMSLAGSYSEAIADAVERALAEDIVVVAAAGNDGAYGAAYPARLPGVIGVGSTTNGDQLSWFSNWGPGVDLVAPGSAILSTIEDDAYATMSGTSMASPLVAALAALVRSHNTTWTRDMVEDKILATVEDLGEVGPDSVYGEGRIEAAAALDAVALPEPTGDEEIPGVALASAPTLMIGRAGASTDPHDVYRIYLGAGDRLTLKLTANSAIDFDVRLFSPTATQVGTDTPVQSSEQTTYPEWFYYTATTSGNHYIDVAAMTGSGKYSLAVATLSAGSAADDDIPGTVLPASPVNGTLHEASDPDDVFAVDLEDGEYLTLTLTGAAWTDFDVYVFRPGALSVLIEEALAVSREEAYPEQVTFVAPEAGTYYIDLYAYSGTGSYQMSYTTGTAPVDTDADVPGVPFPGERTDGDLGGVFDPLDVYSIDLEAGQKVSVGLIGDVGTDFDAFLFGPDTPSVNETTPLAYSATDDYPERLRHAVQQSGTYYVAVHAYEGSGSYSLAWSIDDEVPGVALPSSPATGTLDRGPNGLDWDDVRSVELTAGQWFYAELSGDAGTSFDLHLLKPGASSVDVTADRAASSTTAGTSQERIMHKVAQSGTYYVDVRAVSGAGGYTLAYGLPTTTTVSLTAPTTTSYGGTATLRGTLLDGEGQPAAGQSVRLYSSAPGASSMSYVRSVATTADGSYSFSVKPTTKTSYQVRYVGAASYADSTSATKSVTPKAYVSNPNAPSTMYPTRYYSVTGYLKPRHASGSYPVRIYRWRYVNGAWKSYGYVKAKASNYSSYSKYAASMKLPYRGRWRLRAYHYDSGHAATWSTGYDYVTVR